MNRKRKGTRNEHKTIRWLEDRGHSCTRAAGSLGMFDIIAIHPKMVAAIQVKSNRWVTGKEYAALALFGVEHPNVSVWMVRWDDYAREPKIEVL